MWESRKEAENEREGSYHAPSNLKEDGLLMRTNPRTSS